MPEFKFFSIDEIKDFVGQLKGTRGGKGGKDEPETSAGSQQAPAPLAPPNNAASPGPNGFAPQGGGAPNFTVPQVDPAVVALVQRVTTRIDALVAGGQKIDDMTNWFRNELGKVGIAEAAQAQTMDQVKSYLPRLSAPALDAIAKVINA